jgi:hypothetical protein
LGGAFCTKLRRSFIKIAKSVKCWPDPFRNFEKIMVALWTFRCYISPSGRDVIGDWYGCQTAAVQAGIDVVLEYLRQCPRDEWRRPDFDLLSGKMREIGEIRLKVDKQYRILGFFGPSRSEFTLLIGASKRGNKYCPKEACETALRRMAQIIDDGNRSRVLDL